MRLVPHSGSLGLCVRSILRTRVLYRVRYSSYRISFLSLPIRRAAVRRLETAPPRPKSGGGGIPRRDPRECTSPRRKILFYPLSPFFSLFFSSPLDGNLSVRHATTLSSPFARGSGSLTSSLRSARGLFYPFLGLKETRRSYRRDNLRAAIRDTPTQAPKSSGGCVNQPRVLSYR